MNEDLRARTVPWSKDELMRVNGIPVVYTATRYRADVSVHLPGAPWCGGNSVTHPAVHPTVTELRAAGYDVVLPRFWRYE